MKSMCETLQFHPDSLMKPFTVVASLLLAGVTLPAATLTVLPGEAIQPKIDAAAPGDIVAIFGGTYPDDLVITKAIRLIETDNQDVTLTGNVTWNNVTNAPPFEGFTVGSPGKGIIVEGKSYLVVKNVDSSAGFGIRSSGESSVVVVGGVFTKILQDGGDLTASRARVTGDFETTANSIKTVAIRMDVGGDYLWKSRYAWCGYSKGFHFKSYGNNGIVNLIGCEIDARGYVRVGSQSESNYANSGYYENYTVDIRGDGNKVLVANNQLLRVAFQYTRHGNQPFPFIYTDGRGVSIFGANNSIVANNYIEMINGGSTNGNVESFGVIVNSNKSVINNNIIDGPHHSVSAPFGAQVKSNCFSFAYFSYGVGGHVAEDSITNVDPLFVVGGKPKLQLASPCVNGGVADALFNDLDGTRNDIGPGGGCLFDPTGWTTDKPVVISFDVGPQQLLRGVDTEVRLSRGLGVGGR